MKNYLALGLLSRWRRRIRTPHHQKPIYWWSRRCHWQKRIAGTNSTINVKEKWKMDEQMNELMCRLFSITKKKKKPLFVNVFYSFHCEHNNFPSNTINSPNCVEFFFKYLWKETIFRWKKNICTFEKFFRSSVDYFPQCLNLCCTIR